jgi:hypothetical protein
MSRNYQRQLALLDTPAGDLRAFKKEGGKIRLYDMGGSPSTPEKTTQVVELPDWAQRLCQRHAGKRFGSYRYK